MLVVVEVRHFNTHQKFQQINRKKLLPTGPTMNVFCIHYATEKNNLQMLHLSRKIEK